MRNFNIEPNSSQLNYLTLHLFTFEKNEMLVFTKYRIWHCNWSGVKVSQSRYIYKKDLVRLTNSIIQYMMLSRIPHTFLNQSPKKLYI